jgi:trehalose 6-phosphate phosphatase
VGVGSCGGVGPRAARENLMKNVWTVWPSLQKRIQSAKRRLVILDFDGTLAKIAKTPHEVVLKKNTKDYLTVLSQSSRYKLAVVSGRSLKNLKSFFHIKNAIYAGNHGLELAGDKLSLPLQAKKARKLEALVRLLGEKLKEDFSRVPGMLIEDKNYTLSLHYRNVPREYVPFFKQEVDRFRKQYAHWPLVWKEGKKVWEVRPAVKWDKGNMALYLSKHFSDALPIVIGDDVTDEDMFRALKYRGITIRVGRSESSLAQYYLKSQKGVQRFLQELAKL